MNLELKFNPKKISLDTAGVMAAIRPYIESALNVAEETLLELMKNEVNLNNDTRHVWKAEIVSDLKHVRTEFTGDTITYYAGLDYASGSWPWIRAMVVAYGTKDSKIMAGPYGRPVTDKNLNGLHPSIVRREHEIPSSWYHDGRDFVQNAMYTMCSLYIDILEAEVAKIPASVFTSNIKIS